MTNRPKIIGLTGNIATGKSVVGHMIANSGGLEIDADVVANRMLYPGAPSYHAVLDAFGDKILADNGLISRRELSVIVFSDPARLAELEAIIHPEVTKAIQKRIKISPQPIVLIEAIKLLESDLIDMCDTIWVSHASEAHQMDRLTKTRKMTEEEALSRINAQPPQSEKLQFADVVINTEGSFKNTWRQIQVAVNDKININQGHHPPALEGSEFWSLSSVCALIETNLEDFWEEFADEDTRSIYALLGSEICLPFLNNDRLAGLLTWNNWNFTARLSHWVIRQKGNPSNKLFFDAYEKQVNEQEGEVILLTNQKSAKHEINPGKFGFMKERIEEIPYLAWREAAVKAVQDKGGVIWIKYLNQPIETGTDLKLLER